MVCLFVVRGGLCHGGNGVGLWFLGAFGCSNVCVGVCIYLYMELYINIWYVCMNNGCCKPLLELWNRDPCSD